MTTADRSAGDVELALGGLEPCCDGDLVDGGKQMLAETGED